ncbi:hypothetical protein BS47DRAFT_1373386 [Hydnum rufescens UP504]|uniref:Aminoglycoside phosphotransferase domain-containing protein n=1 Tax=Hydnum rufescens UP504 TaxID=1448309 RepID=A0A9P6DQI2_9AGAM|nr:hypothetical protein BS47DRAFT_1373386 [Hydnum rufescens UP504]
MLFLDDSPPASVVPSHDPRVDATVNVVNWEILRALACQPYPAQSAYWGDQISGGHNVPDTVVVRVPLRLPNNLTVEHSEALCSRIASEVATMQYIEAYTSIPIPHILHYNTEADGGGAASPYMIMTKVEGSPLCFVWDKMEDTKRDAVLRQIVDIYLELSSHRFDKIGALFKRDGVGKDAWYLKPLSYITDPDYPSPGQSSLGTMHSSGTDHWMAYSNAYLEKISNEDFGSDMKPYFYAHVWFLQSLIPSLYDNSLDAKGFPLMPADFHSQNIMVTDVDSVPRIVAVIDWEFSSTAATSSFAQYPLFIVDHPQWDDDHPLRSRNLRDQAKFNVFMNEAEGRRKPDGGHRLSNAFANCYNLYLFEQSIQYPPHGDVLYYQTTSRFDKEVKVWNELSTLLHDEVSDKSFTRQSIKDFILANRWRLAGDSKALKWVASEDKLNACLHTSPRLPHLTYLQTNSCSPTSDQQ